MEKIKNFTIWTSKRSQLLSILFFIIFYFRWLYITPLEFEYYNDPNESIIFGSGLLVFYIFTVLCFYIIKDPGLRFVVGILATTLFLLNLIFLLYFFPRIVTETRCKNTNYIISTSSPLSDPQWMYYQFTKWDGLQYRTFFYGYSGFQYKIVCDIEQDEVNIINPAYDSIDYTDGKVPRSYMLGSARLNNELYILSSDWQIPKGCDLKNPWDCDIYIYTLYKCETDYTSCHALPIKYYDSDEKFSYLEADLGKNEVNLFSTEDDSIIFTYGEHPRCYVEGCEILNP